MIQCFFFLIYLWDEAAISRSKSYLKIHALLTAVAIKVIVYKSQDGQFCMLLIEFQVFFYIPTLASHTQDNAYLN